MAETSYPFLRIARQFGVPYGQVLAYRDGRLKCAESVALRDRGACDHHIRYDHWERAALIALNCTAAADAIVKAINTEQARRERVKAAERRAQVRA